MDTCSNRFLKFVLALATLCGLSGCTYDLVVRAGYSNPAGVYSAVEGPPAAGGSDAGAPVATPDGGRKLGSNANYAYAVGFGANSVPWAASYATPTITQSALASTSAGSGAAGQPLAVTAQAGQAATGVGNNGGNGGNINVYAGNGGTSGSATAGTTGYVNIGNAAGPLFQVGQLFGQSGNAYGAIYPATVTPSASNYLLYSSAAGTNVSFNSATGGAISLGVAAATYLNLGGGLASFRAAIGGLSGVSVQFSGQTSPNTVACGTGGTQTISAAQAIIPFFLVTTGTLSSNAVVDFSTNASTGYFVVDISGVGTITGFTLGFKNGTTTKTISSTQLTALIGTGSTALQVWTYGTNNITILT